MKDLSHCAHVSAGTFSGGDATTGDNIFSYVTLTDSRGSAQTILTGKFGNFRLTEVAAGETYVISVHSRHYRFAPQVVNVNNDLTGLVSSPIE